MTEGRGCMILSWEKKSPGYGAEGKGEMTESEKRDLADSLVKVYGKPQARRFRPDLIKEINNSPFRLSTPDKKVKK